MKQRYPSRQYAFVLSCCGLLSVAAGSASGVREAIIFPSLDAVEGSGESPGPELPASLATLGSIYADFVGSLDQDEMVKQRLLELLLDKLPGGQDILISPSREKLIRDYLESYRHRLDLSWVRPRPGNRPPAFSGPCDEEVFIRSAWVLAPHYALTFSNAILCDPRFRDDISEERRQQILEGMQRQSEEAVAMFDRLYLDAFQDHPIRSRLTRTRYLPDINGVRESIRHTIADPMQAPFRQIWPEGFVEQVEADLRAKIPGMIQEYETSLEPFMVVDEPRGLGILEYISFLRSSKSGRQRSLQEKMTLTYDMPVKCELPELFQSAEELEKFLSKCSVVDSTLLRVHRCVVEDLSSELWAKTLFAWVRGNDRFDLSNENVYCLQGHLVRKYEYAFMANGAKLVLIDNAYLGLDEITVDPELGDAPPCDVRYRPDTRREHARGTHQAEQREDKPR